jgi:MFS family permease
VTLSFGGIGYCIYAISLLASVHKYVGGFNIFAGALLGVCAGLLWTAQGTIMISYPGEDSKGRYFAWFWAIFNMGAVIGSLVRIFSWLLTPCSSSPLPFYKPCLPLLEFD